MKLSVVIPARDEEGSIMKTIDGVVEVMERETIEYEVLVIDDGSKDATRRLVEEAGETNPNVHCRPSPYSGGFGLAVRAGLELFDGDGVAIMMADCSDDPEDLVMYHHILDEGWDCAFGSRFMRGAVVTGYPRLKLFVNRIANGFVNVLFRLGYNDTTNAFKAYRREVIETISPLLSKHFNLTVEIPLKAVTRGHSFKVVPTSWTNRTAGEAKLAMREMGSRYLFIVLYIWLEYHLSRGDYRRASDQG
ncbi:MAG: glycosyltransferase family 2 protein [Solirubrobacterales bacterium]|nr:glycosyltransferase family 2 protein [Solirubrobacterales bacterium]